MLESESSKMNSYSQINPYELIYCNMNIRITEDITRDAAENVVRQIGYLHNAIGLVFKDLIKILSYRFPEQNQPHHNQQNHCKGSPFIQHPPNNQNRQPMDIEVEYNEPPSRPQKFKSRQQEERSYAQPIQRQQTVDIIEDANKQQSKPPNTNIFDQYAYSKETPIQTTKSKDLNSIKLGVAKIIEGVQRKKREGKTNQVKQSREKNERENSIMAEKRMISNERNLQEKEKRNELNDNPMKDLFSKPIESQQLDIFSEFVYEGKPPEQASPTSKQPQPQHQPQSSNSPQSEKNQEDNRLWQFLRQREQPAIYEISDDEDKQ